MLGCTPYNFLVAKMEANEPVDSFSICIVNEGHRMENSRNDCIHYINKQQVGDDLSICLLNILA